MKLLLSKGRYSVPQFPPLPTCIPCLVSITIFKILNSVVEACNCNNLTYPHLRTDDSTYIDISWRRRIVIRKS